ncbi:MAG TPA: 3H domain-containing protein [Methanobacterium sp.]|nr:3H domain-containing protein [Methanobacterium sp.]
MAQTPLTMFPVPDSITPIPFSILRYALIAVGILIIYGFIGSLYVMHLDPVNALYFTIITIATVGYGDISPHTTLQKLFAITLVMGGVGLLAYAFTLTITVVSMTVEEITSGAKQKRRIEHTKNHFILCGYGRVGSAVHKELERRKQTVLIIEKDKNIVEKELWEEPEVLAIPGDATDESIMMDAGMDRAKAVIITTGDDVDNLFITLTAREIRSDIWIVVRASKKENIKRLYRSGADKVISPESSGAEDIYFAAIQPTIMKITMLHGVDEIKREAEIIFKHGCTMENIEYHLPEFKEPLARKIEVSTIDEIDSFLGILEREPSRKKSLERIYESVGGIHSHWISGPNKDALNAMADELKKEGLLLGVDLDEDEIKEVARKYGRLVEVIIKPEFKLTESHGLDDIKEESEIIINNGGTLEDIEYYLPGFKEPLYRKIGLSDQVKMETFLKHLEEDNQRMESLERLYNLSGGGIHTHTISAPDTDALENIENELKEKGFLLGVNLSQKEIKDKIKEYGKVGEMLLRHQPGQIDDKKVVIKNGGRVLDSKHYLPGVRHVVTRQLYIKDEEDLKNCEEEYSKPEAQRSLKALSGISRHIHSHTVSASDVKTIKRIEKELDKLGMLLGVDLPEEEIWKIVENETSEMFCIE